MSTENKNRSKHLLSILNEQITTLLSYEDYTPQIEIDIIKDNMKELYELIDSTNNTAAVIHPTTHKNVDDIDKEINDLLDNAQQQFGDNSEQETITEEEIIDLDTPNEIIEDTTQVLEEIVEAIISEEVKEEIEAPITEEKAKEIIDLDTPNEIIEDTTQVLEEIIEAIISEEVKEEVEIPIIAEEIPKEEILETPVIEKKVEKLILKEEVEEIKEATVVLETPVVEPEIEKVTAKSRKTIHVLDVAPDEEFEEDNNDVEKEVLLAKTLKLKAIKSLKSGIGINDKFMIINDLFEGRTKDFNNSITKLDSKENMQQALYLLGDMKDENLWESDDRVFKIFKKYIQRRYI